MMKKHVLLFLLFSTFFAYSIINIQDSTNTFIIEYNQNPRDRKLSTQEVKERGFDLLANQIVENIDEIDLRKMARSAIFETSYGFRWKMVNLQTGKIIILKVDKNFKLISARNSDNSKIM